MENQCWRSSWNYFGTLHSSCSTHYQCADLYCKARGHCIKNVLYSPITFRYFRSGVLSPQTQTYRALLFTTTENIQYAILSNARIIRMLSHSSLIKFILRSDKKVSSQSSLSIQKREPISIQKHEPIAKSIPQINQNVHVPAECIIKNERGSQIPEIGAGTAVSCTIITICIPVSYSNAETVNY